MSAGWTEATEPSGQAGQAGPAGPGWAPPPPVRHRPLLWVALGLVVLLAVGTLGRALTSGSRADGTVVELASACPVDQGDACSALGTLQQLTEFWAETLPASEAAEYPVGVDLYSGRVATGCDLAESDLDGSFYCPEEGRIYLSQADVDQLAGGPTFTYVVAHEYAHHLQYLTAFPDAPWITSTETGPGSLSVRVELQADCYAGIWIAAAVRDGGLPADYVSAELRQEILASGDDYSDDTVDAVPPAEWTHGDGALRLAWFDRGYDSADPDLCNTLAAGALPTF